jgi:inward rectifier potassium channel
MTEPRSPGPSPKVDPAFNPRKIGVPSFDWRDPYHVALTLSWGAFAGAALAAILAINAVFALLYLAQPGAVQNLRPGDGFMAFFFSLETLSTVGYGEMAPVGLYGHMVAGAEIVVGMAFTAVMTGLVFVRFSRPRARFLFADNLVIASHNGRQMLMLRLANARASAMTSAQVTLGLVLAEVTEEGRPFQAVHGLPLVRSKMPIFPPAWTIMHVIDAASPLHGVGPERLRTTAARFYVAVEGHDTALQAVVQGMRTYDHADIAHGMRYVDMITLGEAGRSVADLSKLGALEPSPPAEG